MSHKPGVVQMMYRNITVPREAYILFQAVLMFYTCKDNLPKKPHALQ